jgi:hypothetical protein
MFGEPKTAITSAEDIPILMSFWTVPTVTRSVESSVTSFRCWLAGEQPVVTARTIPAVKIAIKFFITDSFCCDGIILTSSMHHELSKKDIKK